MLKSIPDTVEGGYGARYPKLIGCISYGETKVSSLRMKIYLGNAKGK